MTATPHSSDLSFLGPFYPLDTIVPQVTRSFGLDYTQSSVDFHDNFIRNRHVVGFEQITVLDRYDPSNKRTVRLMKEKNAQMASRLPADAWVVWSGESGPEITMEWLRHGVEPTHAPVRTATIHSCFDNRTAAVAKAQEVANDFMARTPGSHLFEDRGCEEEDLAIMIRGREGLIIHVVEARIEEGYAEWQEEANHLMNMCEQPRRPS